MKIPQLSVADSETLYLCGNFGDVTKNCGCSMGLICRYRVRISSPLLNRIDIHLDVPRVPYDDLVKLKKGDSSATIRARVEAARTIQHARFAPLGKMTMLINADMGPAEVQQLCELDAASTNLMRAAMQQMNLSARGYHRTLKLAHTIADLAGSERVEMYHLAEALQYRPKVVGWARIYPLSTRRTHS